MTYNHRCETNKEQKRNKETIRICLECGTAKEVIAEVIAFDHEIVKSDRRYREHTEEMPSDSVFDGDKENMSSKAHGKLVAAFSVEDKHFQEDIFGWINSIEDSRLYAGLKRLTDEQLELLYCIYEKGMTFTEFAHAKDISKGAVSQRHRVIINKLKKFL